MQVTTALPRSARIAAFAVILADALTKVWARAALPLCSGHGCPERHVVGPLELVRVHNAGSALGFLQGLWLWAALAVLGIVLVPALAKRSDRRLMLLGAVLLASGGVANVIDRLLRGGVTDFIRIGGPMIFNVADVALAVGAVCMSWSLATAPPTRLAVEAS